VRSLATVDTMALFRVLAAALRLESETRGEADDAWRAAYRVARHIRDELRARHTTAAERAAGFVMRHGWRARVAYGYVWVDVSTLPPDAPERDEAHGLSEIRLAPRDVRAWLGY
jgi:hypothetical protein